MPEPLFPYQEVGANFLHSRDRAGLHDEMGIGKTATAIRALDMAGAQRNMIIVPAMLRENWIKEINRFSLHQRRLCKGKTIHDLIAWQRGHFDTIVTSYEMATRWRDPIQERGEFIDAVVIDEHHYLKNVKTQRTKAILGPQCDGVEAIVGWAHHAWMLSGTPIPNDPVDVFPFLSFCKAMPLGKEAFMRRYFTSKRTKHGSRQRVRPEMIQELAQLIQNNSLRRTMGDVGLQLPPIFLTELTLDGDDTKILQMLSEHPGLEENIVRAVEQGGLSFLDAQHISTLRRLIGEAKAVPYAKLLLDELLSGQCDKKVVFGIHRDTLNGLHATLARNGIKCAIVHGGVSDGDKQRAVEEFQENPACRVFIGQMMSAGTGNTLTAACEVDVLESDWTPAQNAQAIKRVHRISQIRNVVARFIKLANSLDERVMEAVVRKVRAIAEIEQDEMCAAPV